MQIAKDKQRKGERETHEGWGGMVGWLYGQVGTSSWTLHLVDIDIIIKFHLFITFPLPSPFSFSLSLSLSRFNSGIS